ncbi:MAG: RluA family pseudouridine synthase [Endomicrobiaceae bacterium]
MRKNKLEIIFEDQNVLVLKKIPGTAVIPQEDKSTDDIMLFKVNDYLKHESFPVISLDVDASGTVLFAKNKDTYNYIAEQLKNSKVKRTYHIIVNGIMEEDKGEIRKRLIVDKTDTVVSEKGIDAVTKYEVKEQFKNFAFVEVVPVTSRKKQIRAHFWSIGNPLAIDGLYASSEHLLLSKLKKRYKGVEKEKPLLSRLPLHLSKIELFLPDNKNISIFEMPLPDDINITLKQLRKYNKRG